MAKLKRFRYEALSGATSSRLIKLLPALRQESTIRIELSEFHFGSEVEYEALSYTWDDQRPTKEVICNGTVLLVTKNVSLALRRLRSNLGKHRTIWIDSICINQKDNAEKAAQVSNMGSIYAQATQVNIWLSRPTPAMKAAFEYLRLTTGPELQFPRIPDSQIFELRDGFYQLCSHPYWTRIWTVQEVALSEKSHVYLGKLEPMDMWSFSAMLYEVEGYLNVRSEQVVPRVPENLYPVDFQRGSPRRATSMHQTWSKDIKIGDVLPLLMTKKAKNPLDLVLACRALFPDSFGQMQVDYTRDLSDVLREVTSLIVPRFQKPADLFNLVCHCPPVTDAPSWTLNLQCGLHLHQADHYFGVWLTADHGGPNTAHVLLDGKTLCVDGAIVDEVALVSDEFPLHTPQSQGEWHRDARAILRNWRTCTNGHIRRGFEETMHYILYAAANSADSLAAKVAGTVSTRVLFTTASGRMGLGKSVQPGDVIALTPGYQLPFVLRAAGETGGYTLVQPAILEGIMEPKERQASIERGWGTIKIV
ncbi:HET domain-containing protein [Fusarium keratoplasticum]|nr:HET domain-containing protein [Fusarium keratoplasticum]